MPRKHGSRVASVVLACVVAALPAGAQESRGLLVSAADLIPRIDAPELVVLHAGDRPSEFEAAHIPGARFARYREFAVNGPDGLGSELPAPGDLAALFRQWGISAEADVVVYAASPVAAARLFFTLDAAGHPRVRVLDGGLRAWQEAGGSVATGPERHRAARGIPFAPRMNEARLATAAWIQRQLLQQAIALVDVRPDDEFTGADRGHGGAHVAGHIAGARQLPWNTLVDDRGRFLPDEALRRHLEGAGAAAGRPVVAYCMIGMRASVVYFIARHLGYDARLYDGSIIDWGRRGLPTVRSGALNW
jgi:thiosulfate/3-mercaptopyruvate sulfurtransferase